MPRIAFVAVGKLQIIIRIVRHGRPVIPTSSWAGGQSHEHAARHTVEDRLRAVEDTLAIYHLIASHPPAADTGTDRYYRNAFAPDGEIDLGGGKGATGNEAIAAIVKTPEHQAAIAGGLCHFAGLPRVELDGDTAVATSYLQIITPDRQAAPREVLRPWHIDRLPYPPRRRKPLGAQARQRRLEGDATHAAAA